MTLHTIFCCHFGTKILQSRFLQVDLFDWEHSSFFRCLSETFFFQSAHLRDASSQALLTIHHKKCHRHVHRPPATILHSMTNCAIGSQSFLLQISFLANFEGKMLLSKRRWTRSTLWTLFSDPPTRRKVRKNALKTFTQLRKCAQRSKKNANMRSRCSPVREQEGKDTFFFDFGGRFLDRWCSFSLVPFPSAIYSCQGDLATCFTCLYQSKASHRPKKPTWCCEPWPSNMHAA